jgi:predicted ATPase/class 3 adenylate cyclase
VTPVSCLACGTENEPGRKFCGECGGALARPCPACGTANAGAVKFCGECGASLAAHDGAAPVRATGEPVSERRLVSVLFADLVGFTTASETRDAEDTRELLTRYFDVARGIVERYGGTVEKFIGDAVMAVWGTPAATEDDAERAVRAALDLVAAVPTLDPALTARAGVLTGEAAVTLGATGQGMVAGDLVNTASRIQSAAEPGQVLVGDSTRRATEAAIAYAAAGTHALKGKTDPFALHRALRVVAGRRGEGRATGVDPPFVGRDKELRLAKELFHATAAEQRAHLLSIVGSPGMGKSRLAWEFEKYIDGLAEEAWWHRGRCLAYGEGVAYWALAEMVRMRGRIAEDEPPETAIPKLATVLAEVVPDRDERTFIEPRLQHLLGLTERTAPDKEDLFSAWRLFIERMADQFPVIMVFEDIHWADSALLEFVEYLLEWSRSYPVFVITLARPDVTERHPTWGANLRNFTTLTMEALPAEAIDNLLRGLVPGLPDSAVSRVRERAEGVPLYAVETVRMLLDRGVLEAADGGYRMTGALERLDVPETLHALIAARLDGLAPDERRVLQDASVLGRTFSPRGLGALSGLDEATLAPLLTALVRKDTLVLDTDPRSPERGQYGFVQALIQRVAYETLTRRDRKAKHLAAARYLADTAGIDPDEIAEVIATHLLDAYGAEPDDPDAAEIRAEARGWLTRAAERAAALAATDDAQRAFEAAVGLVDEPLERAALLERAGEMARMANRLDAAETYLRESSVLYEEAGATHDRARVAAALGVAVWQQGRIHDAIELMEDAFAVLAADEPDTDVATLAAQLGRLHYFAEDRERSHGRIETALEIGERLELPEVLASALNTKSLMLQHRRYESDALLRQALRIALDHDLVFEALRAYNNLLIKLDAFDRPEEIGPMLDEALALARRRGDRYWEVRLAANLVEEHRYHARWDDAIELGESLPLETATGDPILSSAALGLTRVAIDRGEHQRARTFLAYVQADVDESDFQARGVVLCRKQLDAEIAGDPARALVHARELLPIAAVTGATYVSEVLDDVARYVAATGDGAQALAAVAAVEEAVAGRTRIVAGSLSRLRALAAALAGDDDAAGDAFAVALASTRSVGYEYFLAELLAEYGDWLVRCERFDEAAPLLDEARRLYEAMGAVARIEQLDRVAPPAEVA